MKNILILLPLLLFQLNVFSQDSKFPIFVYGEDTVYNDEFMRVFNKNKRVDAKPTQAEIEEYLQLYIKFKLKVAEAYALKMDTVPSFINELNGYRKQLAQPYLTDKEVNEKLIREAYERSKQEVRAAHILVACPPSASPEDTLAAYKRILNYRNRIVEGGQEFEEIAFQLSNDPSAKNNKGDLGYFTAFQMIYPFENMAFNTAVGEVSMPFRTRFGYHIVKVNDRREALAEVQVAHIMINFHNESDIDSAKRRIDAVYQKLQKGESWATLVHEFSEDFRSASNDGILNWFSRTTPGVPEEFREKAYELKETGQYSEPIKTKYGWHILKLVDKKADLSFEDVKESLRRKVEKDSRSELNKSVVLERVKKENNFSYVTDRATVLQYMLPLFDSSILAGSWKKKGTDKDFSLFMIGGENYTFKQFSEYVLLNQSRSNLSIKATVENLFDAFIDDENMKYEEDHLADKYDDFKYIMQEYKDGILLFELTDQEVWSQAINDTTGLQEFYENNKAKYMYPERAEVTFYSFQDAKTAKKGKKLCSKLSDTELKDKLNAKNALAVTTETRYLDKNALSAIEGLEYKVGTYDLKDENNRVKVARVKRIIPPEAKPMEKNMGQITSDYQTELEKRWIEELKAKYPVKVFDENVKSLYL